MNDLDRIFDRDDVLLSRPVDVVDHRGERRRLSRPGRAGDEHEASVLVGQTANALRHVQCLEVRDVLRNHSQRDRHVAPLPERIDTETRQILVLIGDVDVACLLERLEPFR